MTEHHFFRWLRWAMSLFAFVVFCACTSATGVEAAAPSTARSQAGPGFWEHWGDGRAEIDTYALVQPRYGEKRSGEAVFIYVTETFVDATRVKSDGGHADEFPVIKLNDVRDFQTGIYDYNAMTSSFLRLDGGQPLGQPTKVSLSVQEWCGHVYDQILARGSRLSRSLHSYFDGEADRAEDIAIPEGAVFADAMALLVRGLAGSLLEPGEHRDVPWLPSLLDSRLAHKPLEWTTASLTRSSETEDVQVPLGRFPCTRYTASVAGQKQHWWVEVAAPHRLVKWSRSTGEEGSLLGSTRTKYWSQAREGDEAMRVELGLLPARWQSAGKAGSEAQGAATQESPSELGP